MSSQQIKWLHAADPSDAFPSVDTALSEPNGLLAAGGDLSSERLLCAYQEGIFPWYEEGQPILWWSPDPRCILRPNELRVSKRLHQYARRSSLTLRFNTAFADVMQGCAGERRSVPGTWITGEMMTAYQRLHTEGWAHSVEVWRRDTLVGGLYGLCIGRVFFGESMFSDADNASKFALLGLSSHMLANGLELVDCQVTSRHLLTMGAITLPRPDFTRLLRPLSQPASRYTGWPTKAATVRESLHEWCSASLH